MGNTALIATLAASLVAGVALLNADYSVLASADSQARDEEAVLSERAATGAFEMATSQLERNFGWRTGYAPTSYMGGGFEADVTGPATGPVRIDAAGAAQDTVSTAITGWMTRLAAAAGALTVDADTASVTFSGNNVLVSGNDHRALSWANTDVAEGNGLEDSSIGVLVKDGGAATAINTALGGTNQRIRGTNGNGDVAAGGLPSDFATLLGEATNSTTHRLNGDQTLSGDYGTATAPAIVHIVGDATFVGGGGFGLLFIEGSFKASSDFMWEGIVVADGQNQMDFKLSGDATIRGAAYVTHTSTTNNQVAIGNTETPAYTLWSPDDEVGVLRAYTFGDDGAGSRVEGTLVGWTGSRPQNGDYADSEALAFGPDGTLYIVDNPYRWDNTGQISRLYKVAPDQLDGDPSTNVNVTHVGRTFLDKTNDTEIHGMTFYQGKLYGVGAGNNTIYEISLSSGRASETNTFSRSGAPTCKSSSDHKVDARSLTADGVGNVYVSRKCDGGKTQLYKFDSFPNGNARYVMTTNASLPGIGLHPDGYAYGYSSGNGRIYKMDLEQKNSEVFGQSVSGDIEDMALYFAGEMAAMGLGESPRLGDYPRHYGHSTKSSTVSWPDFGTVEITTSLRRAYSNYSGWNYSTVTGGSLQSFIGQADLGGIKVGNGAPINVEYTGPTELPMLDFRPSVGDYKGGYETITMEFPKDLPAKDMYIYVTDVDYEDLHIVAMDAGGNWLSTSTWEKAASLDLIGSDDGKRTTLRTTDMTGNQYATLRPNDDERDGETIVDEIRIPNAAGIRTLKFYSQSSGDYMGIGIYNRPVFEEAGLLSLEMRDNASIRYSAEAIGRLSYNIPSIAARSTFETFEQFTTSNVDRMFGVERRTDNAITVARDTTTATTTNGGGTSGGSGSGGSGDGGSGSGGKGSGGKGSGGKGSGGGSNDSTIYVCHKDGQSRTTMPVNLLSLATHVLHGDSVGQCGSGS